MLRFDFGAHFEFISMVLGVNTRRKAHYGWKTKPHGLPSLS